MLTTLYYLSLSALFTHELDAVINSEWKMLFLLQDLSDDVAYPIFLLIHFPLFFLFFWLSHHSNQSVQLTFRRVISLFLVIHLGLHILQSGHPSNLFEGFISYSLIYLAAIFGSFYVLLSFHNNATIET